MEIIGFSVGDRVYVTDPGLAMLRDVMCQATGSDPAPNHHGTVEEVWEDDGMVLINFDEGDVQGGGNAAPYPLNEVHLLGEQPKAAN